MRLRIQTRDLELSQPTRRAIERGLRLALTRHAAGTTRVTVSLSAVPLDAAGGARCRIRLRLDGQDDLSVEEVAEDAQRATELALWRLGHRLKRPHHAEPTTPDAPAHGRRAS